MGQGLAHGGPQGQCTWRGLHPLAAAHHQFIAHHIAQAPHGIADGRLGDRQLVRSPGEAALCHHLVKDAQQVQVQGAEVQGSHGHPRAYSSLI